MKFQFEGSLEEFQSVFSGKPLSTVVSSPGVTVEEAVALFNEKPDGSPPNTFTVGAALREEMPLPAEAIEFNIPSPVGKKYLLSNPDRARGWEAFKLFVGEWIRGFGVEDVEQPDRAALMWEISRGQFVRAVLVIAYEMRSLQRMVEAAIMELPVEKKPCKTPSDVDWLDYIDRIAANIVQVSHVGFPELANMYDYSTKWRRND